MLLLMKDDKFVLHFQRILREKLEKSLIIVLEHFMKLGIEVDLQDVLQRYVVCMLAVGFDPSSLSVELSEVPIKTAFTQAEERLLYRHLMPVRLWKLQRWLQIGEEKKLSKALKTVDTFLYQCIASKREKLRCKFLAEEDKYDFVTAFMVQEEGEMTSVDGKSDKLLRDVAVNIMSAGKDTISASLSWFFWLVAMNPSLESKILQEMRANSPSINDEKNMFFSVEGLNRFVYLDAVLCETLRLYPAIPINHKTAIQPDILPSGHHIVRNTRVLINFYAMGRMEEIWGEDCLEFKPERWISERGDLVHVPSHKFIAFNAGPRTCIDDKFVLHFQRILREKLEKSLIIVLEHFMKLGIEVDLQDVLQRYVVCMLAVGFDPSSLSVELSEVPIKTAFTQAEERLLYRHLMPVRLWKLQRWLQIGEEKKLSKALKTVDTFLYQCIASKREKLRCKFLAEEDKYDFVTAFMVQEEGEMTSVDGKSDKLLRDVAVNIMSAGKDTISASLSWFFWLVAMNPSLESKILQEMRANSPSINDEKNMFFSVEGLNRFVYLDAVLCETLRLYPAIPINHKTAIQPDILPSGHHIVRNTRVLINFYAMGRMEEIWGEDCLEFKPERWISERGDLVHVPSHKFIAFNAGPRTCIGRKISFVQMKLVAISVLWNYQIQVVQGHHVAPSNAMVLHMKNGLK
ncbi:Cytochrome P450 - like 10, partial [Theobroma cacao]